MSENRVWSHGGSCGDIIAHLTALAQLWQQTGQEHELYLNRNCDSHWRQSEQTLRSLLTLIQIQPYIARCGIVDDYCGTNLDDLFRNPWQNHLNLSDIIHQRLGIHHYSRTEPWLYNIAQRLVAQVVIHRSPRYHTAFDWRAVLRKYGCDAVFIGDWREHTAFVDEFGPVSYWRTETFLDLARVIQGADLFCGNQSSPYWVAQGLRKRIVHEIVDRSSWAWNTHWERPGMWYGYRGTPVTRAGRGDHRVGRGTRLDNWLHCNM